MERDGEQKNKDHKTRLVGRKAAKKEEFRKKKAGIDLEPNRGSNRKAFQGPTSASRKGQKLLRSLEKRETALHVPAMDKTLRHIVSEPPLLVAVVGPPGVGKSTLIRSMVKFYSSRNVPVVRGPITVVAGRSRRVTFVECPNLLTAMCDVAKVADLVLLMVDGSFGFEMETFEFLNIAQVHGFPRMFGVVSHLDKLKTGKALKKRKKFLRHRFWHEVAAGAKVMCLAPIMRGMYRSNDVLKLHRLLICVEPKIQSWRNTHSCVLIDRYEDITAPQRIADDEKCNRTIAFYGYTRGKPLKPQQLVHIPGLGDYSVIYISRQEDPCAIDKQSGGKSQGHKMRHLNKKQKRIYAPYCNVSGVMYDEDAIYIYEDAEKEMIERSGEGLQYLRELQRARPIDASAAGLDVVRRPVIFRDEDAMELDIEAIGVASSSDDERMIREGNGEDDDDDGGSDSRTSVDSFTPRNELAQYGLGDANNSDDDDDDGNGAAAPVDNVLVPRGRNAPDAIRLNAVRHDWSDVVLLCRLKNLFVTGDWNSGTKQPQNDTYSESDDEGSVSEASKGYESEDEEFDAVVRGEKPLTSASVSSALEDDADSDDKGQINDKSTKKNNTGGKKMISLDALAAVNHKPLLSSSWGAFGPEVKLPYNLEGMGEKCKKENGTTNSNYGGNVDYDVLAEDDTNGGKAVFEDLELDGLVSSFLALQDAKTRLAKEGTVPNTASAVISSSLRHDDTDAIQFYDPNYRTKLSNDGENFAGDHDDKESRAIVNGESLTEEQGRRLQKKMAQKKAFDEAYDMGDRANTFANYHHLTRSVEEKKERLDAALQEMGEDVEKKIRLVGYFSGLYVRFVLENVPVEFVRLFDPVVPLIAGGVNFGEDQFQIVHARLKRHRWFPKILKAQDPLLLSMGWRRFQTQPIFATEEQNGRVRYLKYTPQHMHCVAAFYAPVAPANTGFVAIPVKEQRSPNFRISCTGYTIGNDHATNIVKKLKLTGTPQKIMKTTAFIKGMFNSDIEATKFIGAKLKSVSGIRGIVKTVLKGKGGLIRATFEDKIFLSDIVFCRTWKTVYPPRYCSMQRNLVDAEWTGMRSMQELRWEHNVPLATRPDSEYREIKRRQRAEDDSDDHTKVLLSRNQRLQLPFNMKEEFIPLERSTVLQQRIAGATTVAPEPREMRRAALLDAFSEKAEAMLKKKAEAKKLARRRHQREMEAEEEKYKQQLKKAKKETARLSEFRSQHKSRK